MSALVRVPSLRGMETPISVLEVKVGWLSSGKVVSGSAKTGSAPLTMNFSFWDGTFIPRTVPSVATARSAVTEPESLYIWTSVILPMTCLESFSPFEMLRSMTLRLSSIILFTFCGPGLEKSIVLRTYLK